MDNRSQLPMKMKMLDHPLVEVLPLCSLISKTICAWTATWRRLMVNFRGHTTACQFVRQRRNKKCHIRGCTLGNQALLDISKKLISTSRLLIAITVTRFRSWWICRAKGWKDRENKEMSRGESRIFVIGCFLKMVMIQKSAEQKKALYCMTWIQTNYQLSTLL